MKFSVQSLQCAAALPNTVIASSECAGWTSLLLDHVVGDNRCEPFETHPTPDVTLVVATRGEHDVDVLKKGRWHRAVYQQGAAGMTPSGETTRIRWSARRHGQPFRSAHLYLPTQLFAETSDHFRRIGHPFREEPLSALVFNDPTIARAVAALLAAMAAGAPDLYAQHTAQWLATHLLSKHSSWLDISEDSRDPGTISDARLARTVEFMTSSFGQPLSMDRLASEAGISKFHFAKLFHQQTGSPPYRFLSEIRMSAARRMLLTTRLTVAEIAVDCGYPRATAFTAAFTRRFGVSPSGLRATGSVVAKKQSST